MTTVRHLGSANPATPFATIERRSIAVNTANRQIAVGDENAATVGTPLNLIAVRYFDARGVYAINDLVVNGGGLYRAISATGPGAFNTAHWVDVTGTVVVADSQPAAAQGSLWWESDTGILWIYYHDGNTGQWVQAGGASTSDPAKADNTTVVRHDIAQALNATQQERARLNIAAAPLDALAYNGMQVNGLFDVSQEKTPGTATTTTVTYICDGWKLNKGGTMALAAKAEGVGIFPAIKNILYVNTDTAQVSIGATDTAHVNQFIEGYRIARLGWGTAHAMPITIAFWTAHNRVGTYTGAVRNALLNRSCTFTYTQNVSNNPEYKTVTIPGCGDSTWEATNAAGMIINFSLAGGSTYTSPANYVWQGTNYIAGPGQVNAVAATTDVFRIGGVIILPGTQAPVWTQAPLIMRPYDQELVTCKRYWHASNMHFQGIIGAATKMINVYPVAMRATPTVVLAMTANNVPAYAGLSNTEGTIHYNAAVFNGTSGSNAFFNGTYTADARL